MKRDNRTDYWLGFLHRIADGADEIALRHFREPNLQVRMKADSSPVSEADLAIERLARSLAASLAEPLAVLGEEEGDSSPGSSVRLIIDPIDGTRNFVRGIPIFATLLALEVSGEVVAGLVSAPAMNVRWVAAKGIGSYRGTERIGVSSIGDLRSAHLFHGSLSKRESAEPPDGFLELVDCVERTRGFGDFYQHVLVAEGAGEISIEAGLKPWDIAPLQIIAEEAGGRATTFSGTRTIYGGSLLTTNALCHEEVLRILRSSSD